jgi:hypothetical protein
MAAATERAFMPHIWIEQTGFGPKVWAGEITDRKRVAVAPVRFAPLTPAGLDELLILLQEDFRAVGAA